MNPKTTRFKQQIQKSFMKFVYSFFSFKLVQIYQTYKFNSQYRHQVLSEVD